MKEILSFYFGQTNLSQKSIPSFRHYKKTTTSGVFTEHPKLTRQNQNKGENIILDRQVTQQRPELRTVTQLRVASK